MPSNHLILCRPLLLLPSIFPSIRVFSSESTLRMRWPKYWSFSFKISSTNEHPGLISFRMDWLDFLAVQGILKTLLQHHSSKASILRCSRTNTVYLLCVSPSAHQNQNIPFNSKIWMPTKLTGYRLWLSGARQTPSTGRRAILSEWTRGYQSTM